MTKIIQVENLTFEYGYTDLEEGKSYEKMALNGVNFDIEEGSFTAIIGKNGSGKSTLAKNLNGLLLPTSGRILVDGMDTRHEDDIWKIRQRVGMVFQNPDNQLVSSIVEDDVAFGPENLGMPPKEIRVRVDEALEAVGMSEFIQKAPHQLSGGQKQRIAIAGVIAMRPKCIVFDEPTAMLDPKGRGDVMKIIRELHDEGITIILITHFMDEAVEAERIIIMNEGDILLDGSPKEVFRQKAILKGANMDMPMAVDVAERLRRRGLSIPENITKMTELVNYICQFK